MDSITEICLQVEGLLPWSRNTALCYSFLLVAVLATATAFTYHQWLRLRSQPRRGPELYHLERHRRRPCHERKLDSVLRPLADERSHRDSSRQPRFPHCSVKELVQRVSPTAEGCSLSQLGAVLGALVEEGFKEPGKIETMCELGLASSLGSVLPHLIQEISDVNIQCSSTQHSGHDRESLSAGDREASGQLCSATRDPVGQEEQSNATKDLGVVCLQASWLLVQLASSSHATRRALAHEVTIRAVTAFMRALASGSTLAPPAPCSRSGAWGFARESAASSDLRASYSGLGPPESCVSDPSTAPVLASPGTRSQLTQSSTLHPHPQKPCRVRACALPCALMDAVLRNCSWCLLLLCDGAWSLPAPAQPQEDDPGVQVSSPQTLAAERDVTKLQLAVEVGRALFTAPTVPLNEEVDCGGVCLQPGFSRDAPSSGRGSLCEVLVRLVQSWEDLDVSLTAAAVLACVALLGDADAKLGQRALELLLGSPTFGHVCEALYRAGTADLHAAESEAPGAGAGDVWGHRADAEAATTTALVVLPSRSLTRACAVLSQFLSHALSLPHNAGVMLRQAVAEHAVSWLLHAATLPLALQRQLLRQLLGTEGHGALSAAATQLVDAPLALCHIISAPPACHSLLTPDVAGYLLAAAPFGLVAVQANPEPLLEPVDARCSAAAAQAAEAQQEEPAGGDANWEPDAALLGAQALGSAQDQVAFSDDENNDENEILADGDAAADVADGVGLGPAGLGAALAALPGEPVDAGSLSRGSARAAAALLDRPVSTLAVACRLLLACGRLDNAFGAFFSDVRAAGRAAARRRGRSVASASAGVFARRGSLDGRVRELSSPALHQAAARSAQVSSSSSSGGGGFSGVAAGASGISLLRPSGSSGGPIRGSNGPAGGGGAGSSAGALRNGACWHAAGAAVGGAGVASGNFGRSSAGNGSAGGGASASAAVATHMERGSVTAAVAADAYGRTGSSGVESSGSGGGASSENSTSFPACSSNSQQPQAAPFMLTDVMAGVAGLIDAMLWRSASLGDGRCLRAGFVDEYDSMSESTTMGSLEHQSMDGGDGGFGWGTNSVTAEFPAGMAFNCGRSSTAGADEGSLRQRADMPRPCVGCRGSSGGNDDAARRGPLGASGWRAVTHDRASASAASPQGGPALRLRPSVEPRSDPRVAALGATAAWRSCLDGCGSGHQASFDEWRFGRGSSGHSEPCLDGCGTTALRGVEPCLQGEQEQQQQQRQPAELEQERLGSSPENPRRTTPAASAAAAANQVDPLAPYPVYGAAASAPPDSGRPPWRVVAAVAAVAAGEGGEANSDRYLPPLSALSDDMVHLRMVAPTTLATLAGDGILAPDGDAGATPGSPSAAGLGWSWSCGEREVSVRDLDRYLDACEAASAHSDEGADVFCSPVVSENGGVDDGFPGDGRPPAPASRCDRVADPPAPCRGSGGPVRASGEESAPRSPSADVAPGPSLGSDRPGVVAAGAGGSGRLPPYTYFGSPRLTAAALAVPVDVATTVTSMLAASGRNYNEAATHIAIAAAAAAAAAAATASSAGAAGVTTAATTLAASAKATGGAGAMSSAAGVAAAGTRARGDSYWTANCFDMSAMQQDDERDSDTQLAVDKGAQGHGNSRSSGGLDLCIDHGGRWGGMSRSRGGLSYSDGTGRWADCATVEAAEAVASAVAADGTARSSGDADEFCGQNFSPFRTLQAPEGPAAGPGAAEALSLADYPARTASWATAALSLNSLPFSAGSRSHAAPRTLASTTGAEVGSAGNTPRAAAAAAPGAPACGSDGPLWRVVGSCGMTGSGERWSSAAAASQSTCIPAGWTRVEVPHGVTDHIPLASSAATAATAAAVLGRPAPESILLTGLRASTGGPAAAEEAVAVFAFGGQRVDVSAHAFRALRRCSPLLYSWLSRVPDRSSPITFLQVPGLEDTANGRVFLQLLAWAQGVRDVSLLLLPAQQHQQNNHEQPQAPQGCGGAARPVSPHPSKASEGSEVEPCGRPHNQTQNQPPTQPQPPSQPSPQPQPEIQPHRGGQVDAARAVEPLEQLWQLWRAADYLQVDELLTAVEDELAGRFTLPPPQGPAAWAAALSLAGSQLHFLGAASRLAHLCALHFMCGVWRVLGDEELLVAASAGVGVLAPAVAAEVRDRLVALVALADQDLSVGE